MFLIEVKVIVLRGLYLLNLRNICLRWSLDVIRRLVLEWGFRGVDCGGMIVWWNERIVGKFMYVFKVGVDYILLYFVFFYELYWCLVYS